MLTTHTWRAHPCQPLGRTESSFATTASVTSQMVGVSSGTKGAGTPLDSCCCAGVIVAALITNMSVNLPSNQATPAGTVPVREDLCSTPVDPTPCLAQHPFQNTYTHYAKWRGQVPGIHPWLRPPLSIRFSPLSPTPLHPPPLQVTA
jgi:hypothetical protein